MRVLVLVGLAFVPLGLVLDRDGLLMAGVMVLSTECSCLVAEKRLALARWRTARAAEEAPDDDAPPPVEDDGPHDWRLAG